MENNVGKFGEVITNVTMDEAVEEGIALPLKVCVVSPSSSSPKHVAKAIMTEIHQKFTESRSLAFFNTRENARNFVDIYNKIAPGEATCLSDKTEERDEFLINYQKPKEDGSHSLNASCKVLLEGVDIKVDAVVAVDPKLNEREITQMIGRAVRPNGEEFALLIVLNQNSLAVDEEPDDDTDAAVEDGDTKIGDEQKTGERDEHKEEVDGKSDDEKDEDYKKDEENDDEKDEDYKEGDSLDHENDGEERDDADNVSEEEEEFKSDDDDEDEDRTIDGDDDSNLDGDKRKFRGDEGETLVEIDDLDPVENEGALEAKKNTKEDTGRLQKLDTTLKVVFLALHRRDEKFKEAAEGITQLMEKLSESDDDDGDLSESEVDGLLEQAREDYPYFFSVVLGPSLGSDCDMQSHWKEIITAVCSASKFQKLDRASKKKKKKPQKTKPTSANTFKGKLWNLECIEFEEWLAGNQHGRRDKMPMKKRNGRPTSQMESQLCRWIYRYNCKNGLETLTSCQVLKLKTLKDKFKLNQMKALGPEIRRRGLEE